MTQADPAVAGSGVGARQGQRLRIALLHPVLGLGGSERLMLNAASELQRRGHTVTLYTLSHDRAEAFPETCDGSLDIRVPKALPATFAAGRLQASRMIGHMMGLARHVACVRPAYDVVLVDLVAHCLPVLRRLSSAKILFYCHFPDALLAPRRSGGIYARYRRSLLRLEQFGIRQAHATAVNSEFTARAFRQTFVDRRIDSPRIVYPGVHELSGTPYPPATGTSPEILCFGRFEPHKNLELAIDAMALLHTRLAPTPHAGTRLVLAGACDPRYPAHVRYQQQLRQRIAARGMDAYVRLHTSPTEMERQELLRASRCLLFTPVAEHFGLVPIEAMMAGRAVVAVAGGGVLETVRHGESGLLCNDDPETVAQALARLVLQPELAADMGRAGAEQARQRWTTRVFGDRLEDVIWGMFEEES